VRYKVDFTPQALEDISKLDSAIAERITHRPELMEKFIRDDVEWGLHGHE
jgi:mRNA-degrading endonuclease RelE of RelBE toxin-antitoxin system